MSNNIDTIRDDLAFMKSVASDDGRMPRLVGAHFLAAGLIYGLPLFPVWAVLRGYLDMPHGWTSWVSVWSTVVYIPVAIWLTFKLRGAAKPAGPSSRAFAAVWGSVGLTTLVMLFVIFRAGWALHVPLMWQVWTSICFALYGAAWLGASIGSRDGRWALVAAGSYVTAIVNGLLIGGPDALLGCAIGIILWLGLPGLMMMLPPRSKA